MNGFFLFFIFFSFSGQRFFRFKEIRPTRLSTSEALLVSERLQKRPIGDGRRRAILLLRQNYPRPCLQV